MSEDKEVKYLYKNEKKFKKLFDLMFIDFGWAATDINTDALKIWKIFKTDKKQ